MRWPLVNLILGLAVLGSYGVALAWLILDEESFWTFWPKTRLAIVAILQVSSVWAFLCGDMWILLSCILAIAYIFTIKRVERV